MSVLHYLPSRRGAEITGSGPAMAAEWRKKARFQSICSALLRALFSSCSAETPFGAFWAEQRVKLVRT